MASAPVASVGPTERARRGGDTGSRGSRRLGVRRRNRIGYLVLLRRVTEYAFRAALMRVAMVAVIDGAALFSSRAGWAWLMAVPAGLSCYLSIRHWHAGRTGNPPSTPMTRAYSASLRRTDSRHQLNLGSYLDIAGGFLLAAVPAWVTTDLPGWVRVGMLAAAVCFLVNVAACIFNDQTWFNPDELSPPWWHEGLRLVAGAAVAVPVAAIVLPAPWPEEAWLAVVVLAACGLVASGRVWDTDLTLRYTAPLVAEESRAGRDLVITETHGALSTNLRLLEQQTRPYRDSDPGLYDLAVSANARLRETLALANTAVHSADDPETLAAPVYTLARAVGARVSVAVELSAMGPDDRHLARLALSDLVGNALNAGADAVEVRVTRDDGFMVVSVADDAGPLPPGVWRAPGTSSERLHDRLAARAGGLRVESRVDSNPGKAVVARWRAHDRGGEDTTGHERR